MTEEEVEEVSTITKIDDKIKELDLILGLMWCAFGLLASLAYANSYYLAFVMIGAMYMTLAARLRSMEIWGRGIWEQGQKAEALVLAIGTALEEIGGISFGIHGLQIRIPQHDDDEEHHKVRCANCEATFCLDCQGETCPKCGSDELISKGYIYVLYRADGEKVDETSINEEDAEVAADLFYNDFGHKKKPGDRIELVDTEWEAC